jgi:hypothetical protein
MKRKLTALVLAGLGMVTGTFATASPAGASSGVGFALSGCAVTHVPQGQHTKGAVCLEALPAGVTAQAGVQLTFSENGPWGSNTWLQGWHRNVIYYGYQEITGSDNDKASAWQTYCSAGYLLSDHNISGPGAYVEANSHGNFPIDQVGNDQLSAVSTFQDC